MKHCDTCNCNVEEEIKVPDQEPIKYKKSEKQLAHLQKARTVRAQKAKVKKDEQKLQDEAPKVQEQQFYLF